MNYLDRSKYKWIEQNTKKIPTNRRWYNLNMRTTFSRDSMTIVYVKYCERAEIDMIDLIGIANSCKRFISIAKQAFRKKYVEDFTTFEHRDLWRMKVFSRFPLSRPHRSPLRNGQIPCISWCRWYCSILSMLQSWNVAYLHEHSRIGLRRVLPTLQQLITIANIVVVLRITSRFEWIYTGAVCFVRQRLDNISDIQRFSLDFYIECTMNGS